MAANEDAGTDAQIPGRHHHRRRHHRQALASFTSGHVSSFKVCLPACFCIRKARGGGKAGRSPHLFLGQIVVHESDRHRPRQTARDALQEQDQIGLLGEQAQKFTCTHSHEMMLF